MPSRHALALVDSSRRDRLISSALPSTPLLQAICHLGLQLFFFHLFFLLCQKPKTQRFVFSRHSTPPFLFPLFLEMTYFHIVVRTVSSPFCCHILVPSWSRSAKCASGYRGSRMHFARLSLFAGVIVVGGWAVGRTWKRRSLLLRLSSALHRWRTVPHVQSTRREAKSTIEDSTLMRRRCCAHADVRSQVEAPKRVVERLRGV